MKIKAYFVTYRNNEELEKTVYSFLESGIRNYDFEIWIVNNYRLESTSMPKTDRECQYIFITQNNTRPANSTGHLARNWNECLIDGFKDINNPDCDIVMLSQNDNLFLPDTMDKLIESHKKYSFIQNGAGDSFHSYTVDAVKKVGLWDERFCNIGYQEADYFLRQALYNKAGSSITDRMHEREHNPLNYDILDYDKQGGFTRNDKHHMASLNHHKVSRAIFEHKWGKIMTQGWKKGFFQQPFTMESPQYVMYPYFEDKILPNKNYLDYRKYAKNN